jgi:hypothetical protein
MSVNVLSVISATILFCNNPAFAFFFCFINPDYTVSGAVSVSFSTIYCFVVAFIQATPMRVGSAEERRIHCTRAQACGLRFFDR